MPVHRIVVAGLLLILQCSLAQASHTGEFYDFESSSLPGWSGTLVTAGTAPLFAGSAYLAPDTDPGLISKIVLDHEAARDRFLRVSFDLLSAAPGILTLSVNELTLLNGPVIPAAPGLQVLPIDVLVPNSAFADPFTDFEIGFGLTSPGPWGIDNVSLNWAVVPVPGAFWLLAPALAFLRRRR